MLMDLNKSRRILEQSKTNPLIKLVLEQRERIQDDILCILDGLDDEVLENVCQVVVDRFKIILEKLDD